MAWVANTGPRDDAADAARFLTRLAYAVLAIGAPAGLLLHPIAIYLLFPVGVALLAFAVALDPSAVERRRWARAAQSPLAWLIVALLAWAALSILWTPFRVEAWQQSLRYFGMLVAVGGALIFTRPHARATEIYMFVAGVVLAMAIVFGIWIASKHGAVFDYDRIGAGALLTATLAYPAMAGLAARGRDAYARGLLVLALIFLYAASTPGVMIAFLVGFAVLSFAFTGPRRTAREMSWIGAAAIGLAPLFVLVAQPLLRLTLAAKLPSLPPPYPSIAYSFSIVTRDAARLITGHGFQTVTHGVLVGALPAQTPQVALFQIWYELGIVGAWILAAIAFLAFRAIGELPPRISPYLTACFATVIALGVTRASLDDWTWLMMLGLAIVAADAASRSHYLTKRPLAETLGQL